MAPCKYLLKLDISCIKIVSPELGSFVFVWFSTILHSYLCVRLSPGFALRCADNLTQVKDI